MINQDPKRKDPEREEEPPTNEQASETRSEFELPECCRQMVDQMKDESCPCLAKNTASPGILGRLMLRMMKACCGRVAARQDAAV